LPSIAEGDAFDPRQTSGQTSRIPFPELGQDRDAFPSIGRYWPVSESGGLIQNEQF